MLTQVDQNDSSSIPLELNANWALKDTHKCEWVVVLSSEQNHSWICVSSSWHPWASLCSQINENKRQKINENNKRKTIKVI